jgi:hypothetical protein
MIIKQYIQNLFPFLLVTLVIYWVCFRFNLIKSKKMAYEIIILYISAFITFVPVTGLSLGDYILSVNPNFSIGSSALVLALLWPKIMDKPLLSKDHLVIFCFWNVIISLILFSSTLGLIPYDMYASGYNFSFWFMVVALLTLVSVWLWYPLSFIFLAYIAAFNLKLLPSANFFDYLTDGFLFIMSVGVLGFWGWRARTGGLQKSQVEAGSQGLRPSAPR